ncbi:MULTISPECIES: helix-turn-helix transcriptional regulator [unclassified Streptomyces]|uniref:helix-turn-helix transcriptional regulator n=1 Tax=unclassified Streptomyces TaxID=2593676 RepID=UPI002DD7B8E3|nr:MULTISPECIES: helix-turn-helix transcriptional regulator [unclassified Streptomyces]WSA94867.1 helix-turn-helix transcriptional regulator [Streptomyces sp. NBC_01795]WSB79287.1 helix-turn-helix transcriptional regulator [Streptomyces sp. NBC_01775]WSS12509.1 helix-turn-helix transcriptional regulator [Streptomyces sp. NBC_01186]WSS41295.1 helix-turn-helix transcriptional regulator [Streptomyces sp. NBC_01187]
MSASTIRAAGSGAPLDVGPETPGATPGPAPVTTTAADRIRRGELAAFLRSRRERITPEQAGLPRGPRRRTPGLRREEVAHLSAVGVTWYTWLEQARDIQVSAQVLDALSRALMLDSSERAHLFALGGIADPMPTGETTVLPPGVRQMLSQLEPFPACVQNARYDIVAYNRVYGGLLGDLDAHAPEDRNCMWLAFTDPDWSAAMPDREETVRLMAARFRSRMAEHLAEPAWKALLKRMERSSAEFRELWGRHEVARAVDQTKRFLNARVGMLRFTYHGLWLSPAEGARMGVYVPLDEETQARVERLHALLAQEKPEE